MFNKSKSLGLVELHTRSDGGLNNKGSITFGLVGNIRNYNFKITPSSSDQSITNVRPMRESVRGRPVKSNGSITKRRQKDGSMIGTFSKIDGNFSIRVNLK